jgi:hypothetical protein
MVRQLRGEGGSTLHPTEARFADGKFQTQAVRVVTEVVETADNEHGGVQGLGLLR